MLPDFTSSQANKIGAIKSPIMRGYLFISSWNLAPSSGDYSAAGQLPESNRLSKLFREVSLTFFISFLSLLFPTRWVSLLVCKFPFRTHFLLSDMCLAPIPADRCGLLSAVPPFSFPAAAEIYSFPALGVFLLNFIKIVLRLQ